MWEAVVVVAVALVVAGAGVRFAAWWARRQAVARIPRDQVVREARGVTMRVLVQDTRAFGGMSTRNANRTRGDLVLARDRFVLATGRGLLADIGPTHGRPFTSARCTGPGRLVIEGDVPAAAGEKGMFRIELPIPDAEAWADALRPYVREPERGAPPFGSHGAGSHGTRGPS